MSEFEREPDVPSRLEPVDLQRGKGLSCDATTDELREGDPGSKDEGELTLLERLDRRQNHVMHELDELNRQIQDLVNDCQSERRPRDAA